MSSCTGAKGKKNLATVAVNQHTKCYFSHMVSTNVKRQKYPLSLDHATVTAFSIIIVVASSHRCI